MRTNNNAQAGGQPAPSQTTEPAQGEKKPRTGTRRGQQPTNIETLLTVSYNKDSGAISLNGSVMTALNGAVAWVRAQASIDAQNEVMAALAGLQDGPVKSDYMARAQASIDAAQAIVNQPIDPAALDLAIRKARAIINALIDASSDAETAKKAVLGTDADAPAEAVN